MRYAARPYNDKILFSVHEYNFCLRFVVESISEARREWWKRLSCVTNGFVWGVDKR